MLDDLAINSSDLQVSEHKTCLTVRLQIMKTITNVSSALSFCSHLCLYILVIHHPSLFAIQMRK